MLAYLILTTLVSLVILLGTANRYDSHHNWKYWVLGTVVWPLLLAHFVYLRVRRWRRSRLRVSRIKAEALPINVNFDLKEVPVDMKAYHTLEAEQDLVEALKDTNE